MGIVRDDNLCVTIDGRHLTVALGQRAERWRANQEGWRALAQLANSSARILVYGPRERQQLKGLAPAELFEQWRTRIEEVAPAVLLVWPCLSRYCWPDVLEDLGLGTESGPLALQRLAEKTAEAFAALPADLRSLLGSVLGQVARPAWLDWPLEVLTPSGCRAVLRRLMADKPLAPRSPLHLEGGEGMLSAVDALFGPDGSLARVHPRFEFREGQRQFAHAVAQAMMQGEVLIAEAGTGIGKSLGYLVPAALWSLAGNQPVIIATYTRNLQDQLHSREMPLVRKVLGEDVAACVVKGRSNYACLRSVADLVAESVGALMPGDRMVAGFLTSWLVQSEQADLEALSPEAAKLLADLPQAVEEVRAHRWRCVGGAAGGCDCAQMCALRRLRIAAERSHLVITSQALLLADIGRDALPDYRDVVIDEAHHLEETATQALTLELSAYSLAHVARLTGAGGGEGRDVLSGIAKVKQLLETGPEAWTTEAAWWSEWTAAWYEQSETLGEAVLGLLGVPGKAMREPVDKRLTEEVRSTDGWAAVEQEIGKIREMIGQAVERLKSLGSKVREQAAAEGVDLQEFLNDQAAAALALAELEPAIEHLLGGAQGRVMWAEARPEAGTPTWGLYSAPIDVAEPLNETLLRECASLVLTGATITVDESFAFYRQQCGLDAQAQRLVELIVPSPFDWQRQLLLCLPTDLPNPGSQEHADAVVDVVVRLAEITQGGVLVLFTARQRMLAAWEALKEALRELELSLLCQDVSGERWWLLEQMRSDARTVLLGLRSMWEGVDVPGQHLQCVVVEKMPFAVPDDPLVAARMEYLSSLGTDPYHHYYVPEAIRTLRQGVGRLIRTKDDRGVVFLLDSRVHRRHYGRRFINSLPPGKKLSASLVRCLAAAENWFAGGPANES